MIERYHVHHSDFGETGFVVERQMFTVIQEGETRFDNELPPPVAEVVNDKEETPPDEANTEFWPSRDGG